MPALSRLRSTFTTTGGQRRRKETLSAYVRTAPDPRNAIEIFAGSWVSQLPAPYADLTGGTAPLHADPRLGLGLERLGGVAGKRILELGPLEAGHTYLLDRAGAADILAIEGNTHAFLKCLVVKELLGIQSARFVCGDFVEYLNGTPGRVDMVVASGVLYHMMQPVELIARISRVADAVYLWTHYYDEACLGDRWQAAGRFGAPQAADCDGFRHSLYPYEYGAALERADFCGGNRRGAQWLERDAILAALRHFGFTRVEPFYEQRDHPHGPAFAVVAHRQSSSAVV